MPPEPGTPTEWLRYAEADLAFASIALPEGARYEQLAFHSQQAAEKALKAVLICCQVGFPRTHSIAALLDILPVEIAVPDDLQRAAVLTSFATFMRYPVEETNLDEAGHLELLRLAEAVVAWARDIISKHDA